MPALASISIAVAVAGLEAALRGVFREALRSEGQLQLIPNSHPIYHTFYDFGGPPVGTELVVGGARVDLGGLYFEIPQTSYNLQGVFLGDRMVAIYSAKGYVHSWVRRATSRSCVLASMWSFLR